MDRDLLCADVGATHTRLALYRNGKEPSEAKVREQTVQGAGALLAAISSVVGSLENPPVFVGGFAGPLLSDGLRMTNWPDDDRIDVEELRALGLPEVHLLNDLEAAAYGLVDLLCNGPPPKDLVVLPGPDLLAEGPMVLVMPGTGLGSAVLLPEDGGWRIVPGEAQHAPAFAANGSEAAVLRALSDEFGRPASWDDLVSGRGLEWIHAHLTGERIPAGAVRRRLGEDDGSAGRALGYFYAFAGSFARILALAVKATGGVYLAGSSTRSNLEPARRSDFVQRLRSGGPMEHLLGTVPAALVPAELNLRGARAYGLLRSR